MGYQLPIQPIQSQIYANRLYDERSNFAYINRIEKVKMDTTFFETFDQTIEKQLRNGEETDQPVQTSGMPLYKDGFIYPNPANLSPDPDIARVTGKGLAINRYA
ncbi:hypothetical protein [Sporosarcina sp. Te-1]|uniref:hypothetical protein n=1 Tax=Sporosarcina sp. Te-1 TaxID=2818390 RepID=UPI001A9D8001|nr:hypothetical protein [Sporosarcina sp. Te-1]QTD41243.1 hypothetical protein J3U78_21405 [Sporosarcina sp. Te-1]